MAVFRPRFTQVQNAIAISKGISTSFRIVSYTFDTLGQSGKVLVEEIWQVSSSTLALKE